MSTAEKEIARYQWLTTGQAALVAGVSAETILAWIKLDVGGLKAKNIGTKKRPIYRIRPDWLTDFEELRTRNA